MARSPRSVLALLVLGAATLALTASGAVGAPAQTSPTVRSIVYEASWLRTMTQSDIFELASARMALARTQNETIRAAAERLVAEHTTALQQKRRLARTLRIALPVRTDPLQTMLLNQLNRTTDATQYDELFVRTQIAAHQLAILRSGEAARARIDSRVRTYARSTIPTLQEHLRAFRAAAAELGLPEGKTSPPPAPPTTTAPTTTAPTTTTPTTTTT